MYLRRTDWLTSRIRPASNVMLVGSGTVLGLDCRVVLALKFMLLPAPNVISISSSMAKLALSAEMVSILSSRKEPVAVTETALASDWVFQQLREALLLPCPYRYVIFDRDRKFGTECADF